MAPSREGAFRRGLLQLTAEISGCLARCMLIGSGVAAAAIIQAPKHTLKPKLWIGLGLLRLFWAHEVAVPASLARLVGLVCRVQFRGLHSVNGAFDLRF